MISLSSPDSGSRISSARTGRIELHEDGPPGCLGWIGRPAELLIPMTAIGPAARPLPPTAAPGAVLRPGGSGVVHAQIVGNPARFDEMLTAHLPGFVGDLDGLVALWYDQLARCGVAEGSVQGTGKQTTTFSDAITAVRRWLWKEWVFVNAGQGHAFAKLPEPLQEVLLYALAPAA